MISLTLEDLRNHAIPADRLIGFMVEVILFRLPVVVTHHLLMVTHQWDATLLVETAFTLGKAEIGEWCRDG